MSTISTLWNDTLWPWLENLTKLVWQWFIKELAEDIIVLLLGIMSLAFKLFPDCGKKNIQDFNAIYVFKIKKGDIAVTVIFKNGKMKVHKGETPDSTVTVVIADGISLWKFIASNGSVFDFILDDGLYWNGNFNYILKFGYMVSHLLYMVEDKLKLNRI